MGKKFSSLERINVLYIMYRIIEVKDFAGSMTLK